ncbi:adenylate kinase superfamily protein [Toxoplasma gondii ME49]|uniref:Adenylate kinase superfamily protein n=4 Tax=Toxoplasma gondii TaxID=5811 RepID=A0A0F7UWC1_TOXGV|nr:adenylate kinase superfamily protein [Toxoplasma gondii ME49]EPT29363.1 adenylate kinase superfamily protein [Toxoplasma gondii ME49]ESS32217.1 adenylate kinase superfamily protein [Toxoplasma gondii VEG]KYF41715.1 adenylate kinase superfamily protein [Toxoplasma gondii ARI]CEL74462.1 TPA: adenylate kinase, putative [Toxoplasma gondii VEG]|eukprot:XP_002365078.2 adenylate kinase superfamily protein [Toxoplasma gondii ME49]
MGRSKYFFASGRSPPRSRSASLRFALRAALVFFFCVLSSLPHFSRTAGGESLLSLAEGKQVAFRVIEPSFTTSLPSSSQSPLFVVPAPPHASSARSTHATLVSGERPLRISSPDFFVEGGQDSGERRETAVSPASCEGNSSPSRASLLAYRGARAQAFLSPLTHKGVSVESTTYRDSLRRSPSFFKPVRKWGSEMSSGMSASPVILPSSPLAPASSSAGPVSTSAFSPCISVSSSSFSSCRSSRDSRPLLASYTGQEASPLPPLARPPHPLILLCGPPCSGKGSLAALLSRRLSLSHVSTGDLLRKFLQQKAAAASTEGRECAAAGVAAGDVHTPCSTHASQALESGRLVSDDLILQLLHRAMERLSAKQSERRGGVVLEGFPRTAKQVDMLYAINCKPDAIVCLDVDDAVLFQRLGGRLVDPETAQVYGAANPPPEEIRHRLIRRADDKQEVLETRIGVYRQSWREISHRLRRRAQSVTLEPSARARPPGVRTPGDRGMDLTVNPGGRVGEADGDGASQEFPMREDEEEEEFHADFGVVDGGKHIEAVYTDVVAFLRKKFGTRIEQTS